MLNKFLFETIQEEGKRLGMPQNKKRALIREYLQTQILEHLYKKELSKKLSFIGGTSLRLLHGLDRFSEDLDFDNLGLSFTQINCLFNEIKSSLEKEEFEINMQFKKTNHSGIGQLRFLNLLFQLNISAHQEEKLTIKINYTTPKQKPETEIVVLNRFGIIQPIITNSKEFLLGQKIKAIFSRKDLQPRDFYDVAWFLSQNIHPSPKIFPELKVSSKKEVFEKLKNIFIKKIQPNLSSFKNRLKPFLLDETKISYLDIFGDLIDKFIR